MRSNYLWLTKKSLTGSSAKELSKWDMPFVPIEGSNPEKLTRLNLLSGLPMDQRYIMNYEGLNDEEIMKLLCAMDFDVIVIDEVHRLKGGASYSPTKLWRNAKTLVRHQVDVNGCFPIFLTGSLVNNKISEIWAYLHLFDPERFKSLKDFERIFNPVWMQGTGWTPKKLVETLSPNMVRRRKDEVGIELPPKTFLEPELLDLGDNPKLKEIYKSIQHDVLVMLDGMDENSPLTVSSMLAQLHYLRSILVAPGHMDYNYYPIDPFTLQKSDTPVRRTFEFPEPYVKLDAVADKAFELYMQGERSVIFSAQYNKPLKYIHQRLVDCGIKSRMIVGGSP